MVSKRRRYDTVELVTELKRERRNAFLLSLAGIGILLILLLLYVTAIGDEEVPAVPGDDTITDTVPTVDKDPLAVAGATPPGTEPAVAPAEEEDPIEPEPVLGPATVKVVLTKKGVFWLDGDKVGKIRKKKLKIQAGTHEIKAKFGRKIVTTTIELEGEQSYELKIDAKRKRAKLKSL